LSGRTRAEPGGEGCDGGGAEEAEEDVVAFVVASGDRPGLLQAVDRPLDDVALLVAVLVEGWRPSAVGHS
jgi:hypothetical protein